MLSTLLADFMHRNRLSIREAARQCKTSHTTITRALKGERLDVSSIEKIGDWIGVPLSVLLDAKGNGDKKSDKKIHLLLQVNQNLSEAMEMLAEQVLKGEVRPEVIDEIARYTMYLLKR